MERTATAKADLPLVPWAPMRKGALAPAGRPLRVLIVGMADSVHIARWIKMLSHTGWDVHLFCPYATIAHQELENVTVYEKVSAAPDAASRGVRLVGLAPWASLFEKIGMRTPNITRRWLRLRGIHKAVFGPNDRPWHLARLIESIKPDVIHSHEIQHSGYLTLEARERLGGKFDAPWIVSNWGSDIFLFGRLKEHAERIRAVLSTCDYYTCECHRDVPLAKKFGLRGEALKVLPNGGGFDLEKCQQLRQPGPTSARRVIVLKGYQHWAGRGLNGVRALELCADVLKGYRVVIYSAENAVQISGELLSEATGVPVEFVPPVAHDEMLRLHGRARISIGLSISDAISTSFLEAFVMGAFPIQSHTGCADEWARDGEGALLVHPEDPEGIARAIRRALADDALVDRAAEINAATARERLQTSSMSTAVAAVYEAAARGHARA